MAGLDDAALMTFALTATAILIRVSLIVTFLPVLGEDFAPVRVRALLALALTACLIPVVPVHAGALPETTGELAVLMIPEFILGLLLGLTARLVFAAVQFAGQLAGEQIGFGIASIFDPVNNAQISIVAQLYYLFSILIFFAIDGHHLLLGALVQSFEIVPLFSVNLPGSLLGFFGREVAHMFTLAVIIAAPIMAAMLLSNLALGLVSKAVPQINIFIESFPIHILLGLTILGLTFGAFGALLATQFTRLDGALGQLLQLLQ
ncbi:MAG: flagellar biosynthetic protein FliR [Candidatus Sumerlaeia bacterium]|nr:flagellar biosynthetic protein FliR [Candidatus Sumerlaeia bacterium]